MNLSVVIKCSDDEKIWRCIGSIDEKVEIVVSLTPNIEIQEKLNKLKIKYNIQINVFFFFIYVP